MEHDGAGCGGIVTVDTTDDDLRARGYSEAAIAEVRDFQAFLIAKGNLEYSGTYQDWRAGSEVRAVVSAFGKSLMAARSEERKPKESER